MTGGQVGLTGMCQSEPAGVLRIRWIGGYIRRCLSVVKTRCVFVACGWGNGWGQPGIVQVYAGSRELKEGN